MSKPTDAGGHLVYEVHGKDSQGIWEGKRRYSEFDALFAALTRRWPGIPIPVLPPKKAIGNKDHGFVQERLYYLNRFLRKIARFTFIIEGQEFQMFARPQGMKVDQALSKLMPLSTMQKYERIKEAVKVDNENFDVTQRELMSTKIVEFMSFAKRTEPLIKMFRANLTTQLISKHKTIVGYKDMAKICDRYEELNLLTYNN